MKKPSRVKTLTEQQWNSNPNWENAVHLARSYVGVREQGQNRGPEVERFLRNVGLGPGHPWCAAFMYTVLIETGIPAASLPQARSAAGVVMWRNWARAQNRLRTEPRRGDLFYWLNRRVANGVTSFPGHIGIIAQVDGSRIRTFEGNTNAQGSREGDGVYERWRTLSSLRTNWESGFISLEGL